jgi:hypothetical protein
MGKFDIVIETYKKKKVSDDNIDYAISSIKNGTKREFMLESLTADYRGMTHTEANSMLDDLYTAYGGEFKKESRSGYLVGALALVIGLFGVVLRTRNRSWEEIAKDPWNTIIGIGITVLIAGYFFFKAFRGSFRAKDSLLNS